MVKKPHAGREVLTMFLLVIVAVTLETIAEHTRFAHALAFASYDFFRERLPSSNSKGGVVIVDLGAVGLTPTGPDGVMVTSRAQLQELLMAVAGHGPAAIGVDVDFGDDSGASTAEDRAFLDMCLLLSANRPVPIVLGVNRTSGEAARDWLSDAKYRDLAATIIIPHETRRLPFAITAVDRLRSMSAALATATRQSEQPGLRERVITWVEHAHLISQFSERHVQKIVFEEFLVDYSGIDDLTVIPPIPPEIVRGEAFRRLLEGKIVLLGDVERASDLFPVPGQAKLYPGVTLHASAVRTLAADPLYGVTHLGKFVLSAILICGVLVPMLGIRLWASAHNKKVEGLSALHGTLVVIVTLIGIVCAGVLVRASRILWDGFFLSLFALAFHQPVENLLHVVRSLFNRGKTKVEEHQ